MRLWLPHDPGQHLEDAARRELVAAARSSLETGPRTGAGLSVRFRFVHELPAGPLAVAPELPRTPRLLGLVLFWSYALEGVLWLDNEQLAQVYVRREWGRAAGLEVSL